MRSNNLRIFDVSIVQWCKLPFRRDRLFFILELGDISEHRDFFDEVL